MACDGDPTAGEWDGDRVSICSRWSIGEPACMGERESACMGDLESMGDRESMGEPECSGDRVSI